jgi:fermentation-respiration switch protein FrsA (DUF1100 family)
MLQLIAALDARPFETVSITSHDGLRLTGRYYHTADGAPLDIAFHGYHGHALRDFCGGSCISFAQGHNLLLVDQRAHGDSEGNTITFGVKEKYDCIDWVHFVISRFGNDVKILLGGVSMGASTVLMASGLAELPPQVKAITGDCGYSSPEAILRKVSRDRKIPDALGYPFLRLGAKLFGGFSLADGGAVEAVKHSRVPIMIMHGEADDFVPYSMALEIFEACPGEKRLLSIPCAGHGLSYFFDTETYSREVGDFKRRALE